MIKVEYHILVELKYLFLRKLGCLYGNVINGI